MMREDVPADLRVDFALVVEETVKEVFGFTFLERHVGFDGLD
jgi:hypothetical protein